MWKGVFTNIIRGFPLKTLCERGWESSCNALEKACIAPGNGSNKWRIDSGESEGKLRKKNLKSRKDGASDWMANILERFTAFIASPCLSGGGVIVEGGGTMHFVVPVCGYGSHCNNEYSYIFASIGKFPRVGDYQQNVHIVKIDDRISFCPICFDLLRVTPSSRVWPGSCSSYMGGKNKKNDANINKKTLRWWTNSGPFALSAHVCHWLGAKK